MCQNRPITSVSQAIADTTQRMLSHAMASHWHQVMALAPAYQRAVEQLRDIDNVPEHELETRRRLLSQILNNDAAIRRLASPELERLNELINGLRRQRDVLKAYYSPQS